MVAVFFDDKIDGGGPADETAGATEAARSDGATLPTWEAIGAHLSAGDLPKAHEALRALCEASPELPEAWINRGSLERAMGDLSSAATHLERGIALLKARSHSADPLLVPAYLNLAEVLETLEDVSRAADVLREAFRRAPESPSPLIQLAGLQARAGNLDAARRTARDYCFAAVSILSEKPSIALVRKFQKALEAADAIDGRLLLIATREAYAMAFESAAFPLRESARFEVAREEVSEGTGDAYTLNRSDAFVEATNEWRTLTPNPVYGFPGNAPAAREALFTVPAELGAPFETRVSTRTAWNALAVRVRFREALDDERARAAEDAIATWFRRGFTGGFSLQRDKGFFHALSRPVRVGERALRWEIDLGLANQTAIAALIETLADLHQRHPIDRLVLGDGLIG